MKKRIFALLMSLCMMFSMSTIALADVAEGTQENPEILAELTGDTITVAGGTMNTGYNGYYYEYTVPENLEGTVMLSFSVDEATADAYSFNVDNLTSGAYFQITPQYTDGITTGKLKAAASDVIQIKIMSDADWMLDDPAYPEITMTWSASVKAVGTANSPEEFGPMYQFGAYSANGSAFVVPNGPAYYYSYTAEETGRVVVYVDENSSLDMAVQYPGIMENDPAVPDSLEELAPEIVLTAGETTTKWTEDAFSYTIRQGRNVMTVKAIALDVKKGQTVTMAVSSTSDGYEDGLNVAWGATLEAVGTETNPQRLEAVDTEVTVDSVFNTGSPYYFAVHNKFFNCLEGIKIEGVSTDDRVGIGYDEYEFEENGVVSEETLELIMENGGKFGLVNYGDEKVDYKVSLQLTLGSELNPEVLEGNDSATNHFEILVEEGEDGETQVAPYYYYTWTSEKDGFVTIKSESATAYRFIAYVEGSVRAADDFVDKTTGGEIVLPVNKGDKVIIMVQSVKAEKGSGTDLDGSTIETVEWIPVEGDIKTSVTFEECKGGLVDTEVENAIVSDINTAMNDGSLEGNVELNMCDANGNTVATVVPASILAALAEYNEYNDEVALEVVMNGYSWVITDIEEANNVDLQVTFDSNAIAKDLVEAIANGNKTLQLSLAHNGDFGFTATLATIVDKAYVGNNATLYWNNNGTLEKQGTCVVAADGTVKFDFTHASDYVVVFEEVVANETPDAPIEAPKTGDSTNFALWIAVLGLGVVAMAGSVVMKKREF